MKVHTVVVGLLLATGPASSVPAAGLEVVPSGDGIRVRVAKQGLFAGFAHDHDFEVTRWRGTANVPEDDPGRVSVELVLDADSLRDHEKGLSESDARSRRSRPVPRSSTPRITPPSPFVRRARAFSPRAQTA